MSDHKEDTQLNNEDLRQVHSLIGDADSGDFTLDDILAEYGVPTQPPRSFHTQSEEETDREGASDPGAQQDLPWPEPPHTHTAAVDNVVAFPGPRQDAEDEEEDEDPDYSPDDEDADDDDNEAYEDDEEDIDTPPQEPSNLVQFPTPPEPGLKGAVQRLRKKADVFADRMFEHSDNTPEARRLEKLIPGTDEEDDTAQPVRSLHLKLPRRPDRPAPEDCPPYQLFRTVSKTRKNLRGRSLLVMLFALLAVIQLLIPISLLGQMGYLGHPRVQVLFSMVLTLGGILLSGDVLLDSLRDLKRGLLDMTFMTGLAGLCTVLDGAVLILVPGTVSRLPFAAVVLAGLFYVLHGAYHQKLAVRLSCRTAAASGEPFRVTLDARKWNGQDTYTKWVGDQKGFGAQMQTMDGARQMFCRLCPFLLLADIVLAVLNTFVSKNPPQFFWALSAMLISTAAFGGSLVYARPFHKISIRLAKSGAALAGWPGVESDNKGNRVLLTDNDLFPTGHVSLNGYKVMPGFSGERVLAYTATMIRDSGSGLEKPFHDQLRAVGGRFRTADHLWYYDGGGMSANIRGDRVLVGCADFMVLQEVALPSDMNVTDAVFCAINGELAGIFALQYSLPGVVPPAVEQLLENQVNPVLATRDFNIIPGMLQRRFKLESDKMDFPPIARRRELSAPEQLHSGTLTALLCREGLSPFADVISAAKRLRRATLLGTLLCCIASVLGLVLTAYLTSVSAFSSLTPLNLLIYMFTWLAPVWFLSSWAHRY